MRDNDPATDPHSLETILRRYLLSGDEEALEQVVEATRPRLLGAARKIGAPQDAEDAVQSAYLSLVRKRGAPLEAPVLPWLLTAVIRIAYRRKALQKRETPIAQRLAIPATGVTPIVDVATKEEEALVRREVLRLPPKYRDPVVLHYLQGLTQAETAVLLEVPEATVRTRLHRARKLLHERLSPQVVHAFFFLPWAAGDALDAAWTAAPAAAGTTLALAGALLGFTASDALPRVSLDGTDSGDTSADSSVAPTARVRELARLENERDALRAEIDDLRAKARKDRDAVAKIDTVLSEAAESAAGHSARVADHDESPRARYRAGPYVEVLDDTNWNEIGRTLHELIPLVARLNADIDAGVEVTDPAIAESIGRQQELNGPLVAVTLRLYQERHDGGFPTNKWTEESPNAGFTHPSFMANALAATLDSAGLPLDETQNAGLESLATRFTALETRRLEGYGENTWRMQRLIDEADLRQEFFDEVEALLTNEQAMVLWPEAVRGTIKDIFSSGLIYNIGIVDTFEPRTRHRAILGHMQWLSLKLDVPEERRADLFDVVAEWLDALPESRMSTESTILQKHEVVSSAGAREAALHAMDLLRAAVKFLNRAGDLEKARNVVSIPYPTGKVER
ncbi:MAG: RNA polymerase sigma factor [Planctomycetota bacterium]